MSFLPESVLLAWALGLFVVSLGEGRVRLARGVALATAIAGLVAALAALGQVGSMFEGAYRVDAFSQGLKVVFSAGFLFAVLMAGDLPDTRADIKPEFFLFLSLSVLGFELLVSSVEVITLVVALELSSFPLYLAVAMRRERPGQRVQMESAIKYIMFGVAANGIMLFGLGYLYGLTGTTSLPLMVDRLGPIQESPLVVAGLAMTFGGLFYKLAILPFQFWTPDVYEGASHETAGIIASLPKVAAVAVLFRFVSLTAESNRAVPLLLAVLAVGSMFYGNLIAMVQRDFKRLLGFSGIAHAGYALVGFVALDRAGYAAAIYYMVGYLVMVLACFTVISRVSNDGANVDLEALAGLHRRSPLLAVTLLVGVFALAGIPPFAGFMGKLALFTAALKQGHLAVVVLAVINAAIAVYYYLRVVREAYFGEPGDRPPIRLDLSTTVLCGSLIVVIVGLGVAPAPVFAWLDSALGGDGRALATAASVLQP